MGSPLRGKHALTLIYEGLTCAGHADVISREVVRHTLPRQARQKAEVARPATTSRPASFSESCHRSAGTTAATTTLVVVQAEAEARRSARPVDDSLSAIRAARPAAAPQAIAHCRGQTAMPGPSCQANPLRGRLNGNGAGIRGILLVLQRGVGSRVSASFRRQIESAPDRPDRVEGAGASAGEHQLARPPVVDPVLVA
jgi:hypothetical protein